MSVAAPVPPRQAVVVDIIVAMAPAGGALGSLLVAVVAEVDKEADLEGEDDGDDDYDGDAGLVEAGLSGVIVVVEAGGLAGKKGGRHGCSG